MLTDAEDAMGHAFWDELHGRPAREIVERDDGFIESSAIQRYFAPFEEWDESARGAMAFVRGRVLDVGVGAGRRALHLEEQGHEVVGIDVSPLAVEVCGSAVSPMPGGARRPRSGPSSAASTPW